MSFATEFLARVDAQLTAQGITDEIQRQEAKTLKLAGAKIRRKARDLLRRRKAASQPGQPPSHHARDQRFSLKWIQYDYDRPSRALVIGPLLTRPSRLGGETVPQIQEFGGPVKIRQMRRPHLATADRPADWQNFRARAYRNDTRHGLPIETRYIHRTYPARPWMIRALEIERQAIPDAWRGAIGG